MRGRGGVTGRIYKHVFLEVKFTFRGRERTVEGRGGGGGGR